MFTYDKDKEFRQITKSFLYPVLLYLRQMSLNLIDTGGIAGVRAHNSGVEPDLPADIFCQKLTATSGL